MCSSFKKYLKVCSYQMDILWALKSIKMGVIENNCRKIGLLNFIKCQFFSCKNTYYSNNSSKTIIKIPHLKL